MSLLQRSSILESILYETNNFIGDARLKLTHVDPSFLLYDPRSPSAWLTDITQAEYLIENGIQIQNHGRNNVMERILLLPAVIPVMGRDRYIYLAAIKACVHLQLYEGVRVLIVFVRNIDKWKHASATFAQVGKLHIAWPSEYYYGESSYHEVRRASLSETDKLERFINELKGNAIKLTAYQEEHFAEGIRGRCPQSWREFLVRLQGGICLGCWKKLGNTAHIDHQRPLNPKADLWYQASAGNSVLFNLCALCANCNLKKSNKLLEMPEVDIDTLIWDKRLQDYFLKSIRIWQRATVHVVPKSPNLPYSRL